MMSVWYIMEYSYILAIGAGSSYIRSYIVLLKVGISGFAKISVLQKAVIMY